ncbi:MAG: extensin family protein [Magnetospirillum sp.]|nr:extensin family protein [Magnetospirillum sp.]
MALLALLAACGSPPQPPPPASPEPPTAGLVDPDTACLRDLAAANATFQPLGSFGRGSCRIANPVRISGGPLAWNHPGILTCRMARTLIHFETDVVQPLALKHFHQAVVRIDHFGTYDCRVRRTETTVAANRLGTSKGGRLSEHAMGRAIDLAGFELADGTVVSVKKDWHAGGQRGAFLHEVARASCRVFNVVLTPNHDRLHQDHIHLDIGPNTLCGY